MCCRFRYTARKSTNWRTVVTRFTLLYYCEFGEKYSFHNITEKRSIFFRKNTQKVMHYNIFIHVFVRSTSLPIETVSWHMSELLPISHCQKIREDWKRILGDVKEPHKVLWAIRLLKGMWPAIPSLIILACLKGVATSLLGLESRSAYAFVRLSAE